MEAELQKFRRRINATGSGEQTPVAEDAISVTSTIPPKNSDRDPEKNRADQTAGNSSSSAYNGARSGDNGDGKDDASGLDNTSSADPYTYKGLRGWRSYRCMWPFRGMYYDIKRRLPDYWSDITDAWSYKTVSGTIRIYFVNLLPAIAFVLDMYRQAGQWYGVNEALFASALAGIVFSIFSAQPITIVGVTGLIGLFNYTIYDIVKIYDVSIYPRFMCWTAIFSAITHWLIAIFNICDYMKYVTDFSSQTFGLYVGIIYILKGIEALVAEFDHGIANGYMSIMVALLFFFTIYSLEKVGEGTKFNPMIRGFLGDYSYPIAVIFWVGFSHIPGHLKEVNIQKLSTAIGPAFRPTHAAIDSTQPRNWLIDFWKLEAKWICASIPFGVLVTLLFYYDHNVSSLTAQAKQFPLKKPGGFHWDFFLLGITTFIGGIFGLPLPNGLVPQAPIHTDSLCVYQTDLKVIRTEDVEGEEIRRPEVRIVNVIEQRITHFAMALLLIGTTTKPLLVALGTMPTAIFAGVFLTVGFGSILGNGITHKLLHVLGERRFLPPDDPLYYISTKKIGLYIFLQIFSALVCVAISQTLAAVGFPILICALIPFRWLYMPRWFAVQELDAMDALTAALLFSHLLVVVRNLTAACLQSVLMLLVSPGSIICDTTELNDKEAEASTDEKHLRNTIYRFAAYLLEYI